MSEWNITTCHRNLSDLVRLSAAPIGSHLTCLCLCTMKLFALSSTGVGMPTQLVIETKPWASQIPSRLRPPPENKSPIGKDLHCVRHVRMEYHNLPQKPLRPQTNPHQAWRASSGLVGARWGELHQARFTPAAVEHRWHS